MKVIAPIILLLVAIALGIGWLSSRKKTEVVIQEKEEEIASLSNQVLQARNQLDDQQVVALTLEQDLAARAAQLQTLSNDIKTVSADLARTQAEAKAAAEAAAAEIAKRDSQITDLETQRADLSGQMNNLNTEITSLEVQIAATERRLAESQDDREFLLAELKRLEAEKADLERKFNDLALLREQVRRLRDELSVARRLEWIRQGIYSSHQQRGAERLFRGLPQPMPPSASPDLEVDLTEEGQSWINVPGMKEPAP